MAQLPSPIDCLLAIDCAPKAFGFRCYPFARNNLLPMCPEWTQKKLARPEGFEPPTGGLEIRCSIRLSYGRRDPEPEVTSKQADNKGRHAL
jgi:hypothetical protein